MSGSLVLHCGARQVTPEQLALVPCPPAEGRWRPVPHHTVLEYATTAISNAGYEVEKMQLGLTRDDARFFGCLTLKAALVPGISLAVGLRSSIDKSLSLGACFGSRTFVCDNLAFTSEKVIAKKHTTFAVDRYREAVSRVLTSDLGHFRELETARIRQMIHTSITDERAESIILRAYQDFGLLSPRNLPAALKEWREPSFGDAFAEEKNVYRLWQALTFAVGQRSITNPNAHADQTIRISGLLTKAADLRPEETHVAVSA